MTRSTTTASVDAASLLEQVRDTSAPGPRLVDVRTPAEFEASHIPGSINVPLDIVRSQAEQLCEALDGQQVVLVCRSGQRAGQAQQSLVGAGLPATALQGGVTAWEGVGGDLNRGRQVWELERQVRLVAGLIVLLAVLGSVLVPGLEWVAAFVGAGLTFAALSNSCAMGAVLSRMPWNRRSGQPSGSPLDALRTAR
jgi:rhodanese-related sulfurtransferase